jgi:hypothetical protein
MSVVRGINACRAAIWRNGDAWLSAGVFWLRNDFDRDMPTLPEPGEAIDAIAVWYNA